MFNNKNIQDSYFLKIEEMEFLFMNSRGFWLKYISMPFGRSMKVSPK
jgi:hypothetical protein